MGSKSKKKKQQMNFSDAVKYLSDLQDQKHLEYTKHFTQTLSTMKVRLEALEDVVLEKLGETEDSIKERMMLRVEKMQGFNESTNDVLTGSVIRIKVKEEIVGQESPTNPMQDAYMVVGSNQINPAIDIAVLGAKLGETKELILDDPTNAEIKRKVTVTVLKIFKGEETKNETKTEAVQETQAVETPQEAIAAQS